MPSSSVSMFVRGGGGGGRERGMHLKSDSYFLYYVHTGNSFTAILRTYSEHFCSTRSYSQEETVSCNCK